MLANRKAPVLAVLAGGLLLFLAAGCERTDYRLSLAPDGRLVVEVATLLRPEVVEGLANAGVAEPCRLAPEAAAALDRHSIAHAATPVPLEDGALSCRVRYGPFDPVALGAAGLREMFLSLAIVPDGAYAVRLGGQGLLAATLDADPDILCRHTPASASADSRAACADNVALLRDPAQAELRAAVRESAQAVLAEILAPIPLTVTVVPPLRPAGIALARTETGDHVYRGSLADLLSPEPLTVRLPPR